MYVRAGINSNVNDVHKNSAEPRVLPPVAVKPSRFIVTSRLLNQHPVRTGAFLHISIACSDSVVSMLGKSYMVWSKATGLALVPEDVSPLIQKAKRLQAQVLRLT